MPALRKRLAALGIVSKRRTDRYGRVTGGSAFSTGALYHLLRNPVYAGKVKHGGALHEGQHEAIIDAATWQQTQHLLDGNGGGRIKGRRASAARWLDGRLYDRLGRPMRTTYATRSITSDSVRRSKRYWYYVSKPEGSKDKRSLDRLPAGPLEDIVREAILRKLADRAWVADSLAAAAIGPDGLESALAKAEDILSQQAHRPKGEHGSSLEVCLHRIDLGDGALTIRIDLAPVLDLREAEQVLAPAVPVPIALRRNGRNRPIVLETNSGTARRDADLIALVADARRWMDDLAQGRARTVAEITEREGLRPGAVSRILPLAWLAPDIATAILEGHQPADLTARRLRELPDLPVDWSEQRSILGFSPA